jgi:hypothetical protein
LPKMLKVVPRHQYKGALTAEAALQQAECMAVRGGRRAVRTRETADACFWGAGGGGVRMRKQKEEAD